MYKKSLILVFGLIVLLSSITAVFGAGDKEKSGGETVTLVWQTLSSDLRNSMQDEYIAEYEEMNPGVKIEHVHQENDTYKTAIQVALASDDPPDMFFVWGDEYCGKLVRAGQVADLSDLYDSDWGDSITDATKTQFTFAGKIYAVPRHLASKYFYYNKAHFEDAGVKKLPETWSELLEAAEKLKSKGYTPFTIGGKDSWQECHWLSIMNQKLMGLDYIMDDYNLRRERDKLFSDPRYVKALAMFRELADRGYFVENAHAIPRHASDALFYTGKASTIYAGTWAVQIFKGQRANTAPPEFADAWGMFRFPDIPEGDGDQNVILGAADGYAVSSKTPNLDVCADFLKFTTKMENAKKWASIGNLSSVKGAVTPDIVDAETAWIAQDVATASGMVGWMDTTIEASVVKVYLDGLVSLLAGYKTPEEVMAEVKAQAQKVQDEKGPIVYK